MYCTRCRRAIDRQVSYCPLCGSALVREVSSMGRVVVREDELTPSEPEGPVGSRAGRWARGGGLAVAGLVGIVGGGYGLGVLLVGDQGPGTSRAAIEPLPVFPAPPTAVVTPSHLRTPMNSRPDLGDLSEPPSIQPKYVASTEPSRSSGPRPTSSPDDDREKQPTERPTHRPKPSPTKESSWWDKPAPAPEPTRGPRPAPGPDDGRGRDGLPPHVQDCGGGVGAGPAATCAQAQSVAGAVPGGAKGVFTVEAGDGQGGTTVYTCVSTRYVLCTGGMGVTVYIARG